MISDIKEVTDCCVLNASRLIVDVRPIYQLVTPNIYVLLYI